MNDKTANAEALFDESIASDDNEKLEKSVQLTLDEWVYFFMFERDGRNTPVSTKGIEYIVPTGKEYPINIPLVKDSNGVNGVIYFTLEFAIKSAEFNCKIGKMKGNNALKMFLRLSDLDAVYLQSSNYHVRISKPEMRRFLTIHP